MTRVLSVAMLLTAIVLAAPAQAEAPTPSLLEQVIRLVRSNYLAREQLDAREMFAGALRRVASETTDVLVVEHSNKFVLTAGKSKRTFVAPASIDDLRPRIEEAIAFTQLRRVSVDTRQELEFAAIRGLVAQLDPHSAFIAPEEFKAIAARLRNWSAPPDPRERLRSGGFHA